jgi:hypothetical protein
MENGNLKMIGHYTSYINCTYFFAELQRQSLPNELKIKNDWTENEYEENEA